MTDHFSLNIGLLVFLSFVTLGLAGNLLGSLPPGFIPFVYVQLDVAVPVVSLVAILPVWVIFVSVSAPDIASLRD